MTDAQDAEEDSRKPLENLFRPGYVTTAGSDWLREKARRTIAEYEDRAD